MKNKKDIIDVSVIIVSWNTNEILKNCIKSIYNETQIVSFEIIVIDNDSADGTPDMINKEFPEVILIANKKNRGFAAANNQGLRIARGRYSLLLNPDTVILENAIDKMVPVADQRHKYAVFGCKVYEKPDVVQLTCFTFPGIRNMLFSFLGTHKIFPNSRLFGRERMTWWHRDSEEEVEVISGMFMLVRKEAIDEIGLMDEDYFIYVEEADWCYRFWKGGWGCFFTPIAKILHLDGGSKSTEQISIKMFVQLQKSILIFHRKNYGKVSWFFAKTIYIMNMFQRCLIFYVLYIISRKKIFHKRYQQTVASLRFLLLGREPVA